MAGDAVVHVIDDDESVRQALSFLLTASGMAVRTYETGTAFLASVATVQGGCILSDVRMPGIDGINLQRRLNELNVKLPLIIMTGHGDVSLAVEAMKAGAVDFIEKPFDDETLLISIRSALDRYSETGRREAEIAEIEAKLRTLSMRERQVLDGVVAGQANKMIAYDLDISPRTVEIHRANVMTKMDANNLSDLIRMALLIQILPGK